MVAVACVVTMQAKGITLKYHFLEVIGSLSRFFGGLKVYLPTPPIVSCLEIVLPALSTVKLCIRKKGAGETVKQEVVKPAF